MFKNSSDSLDPLGLWTRKEDGFLTRRAMQGFSLSSAEINEAIKANIWQDHAGAEPFDGAERDMPGDQKSAEKVMDRELKGAVEAAEAGSRKSAMIELGKGMHAVQDKCAHFDQDAGWIKHIPFIGTDPDQPSKHPLEFKQALVDTQRYLERYLQEVQNIGEVCNQ